MEHGLVTVVIPVYKTEKYLNQCVQSIVDQTYKQLQILLIDDGSPDRCPQMCDDWAARDSRIQVIHKNNEGLGQVRNTGIREAKGEFLCFVDSDDYLALDAVEKLMERQRRTEAEVVVYGIHTVDNAGRTLDSFSPSFGENMFAGDQVQKVFLPELIAPDPAGDGRRKIYMSMCLMLFSVEMLHSCGWRCASERTIISEDVYSLLELFRYVKCVALLEEPLYFYRENLMSLSRTYRQDRYEEIRHFYLESMKLCEAMGYGVEVRNRLADPFLAFTRAAIKQEAGSPLSLRERRKHIRSIVEDETLQEALRIMKKDNTSFPRRLFFFAMIHKCHDVCFALAVAQSFRKRK